MYDVFRIKNTTFLSFSIPWLNTVRYCVLLILFCSFDYSKECIAASCICTAYVDEIFPALQYFFKSGLHQKSVGTSDSTLSIQITYTIAQIELLDSQLNKIEEEMTDIMKFNGSFIMTIPGIGYINGGMILGEIGNIHRFSSPGKLLAFAGLDPSIYHIDRFV